METKTRRIDWRTMGERRSGLERRIEQLEVPENVRAAGDRRQSERRQAHDETVTQAPQGAGERKVDWFERMLDNLGKGASQESQQAQQTQASDPCGAEASQDAAQGKSARAQEAQAKVDDDERDLRSLDDLFQKTVRDLRATRLIDRTVPNVEKVLREVLAQLKKHDVGGKIRQAIMGNVMALRRQAITSPNMPPGSAELAALLHSTLEVIDRKAYPLLRWRVKPCKPCP